MENHYIESFNSRLRDECLNTQLFYDLNDAQAKLDEWLKDYNTVRPHSALSEMSPAEFAQKVRNKKTKQTAEKT